MNEIKSPIGEQKIRVIVQEMRWYRSTENGIFSWELSVQALAQALGIVDPEQIGKFKLQIEEGISSDYLSKFFWNKNGLQQSQSLVEALFSLKESYQNLQFIIWSEGDREWQKKKIQNSGLQQIVLEHTQASGVIEIMGNKTADIIAQILVKKDALSPNKKAIFVIVDDKKVVIDRVLEQWSNLKPSDFLNSDVLETYHFSLNNLRQNANALYLYIKALLMRDEQTQVIIFLDFDGVVFDTFGFLYKQVPIAYERVMRSKTLTMPTHAVAV